MTTVSHGFVAAGFWVVLPGVRARVEAKILIQMSCGFTFASRGVHSHTLFGVSCRNNFYQMFAFDAFGHPFNQSLSQSKCSLVFFIYPSYIVVHACIFT